MLQQGGARVLRAAGSTAAIQGPTLHLASSRWRCDSATAAGRRAASCGDCGSSLPRCNKLCVLDGHNLSFMAYWAIAKGSMFGMQTPDGIPTTVTFGFMRMLLALLEQEQPRALVVVFDAPQASFRRELLPEYKSGRERVPAEFHPDLSNLQQLLRCLRVATLVSTRGYEADDVMAGLARQASAAGWSTTLVSSDRDLWQLVDDSTGVSALLPGGGKTRPGRRIDAAAVQHDLGVAPCQVPDFKALAGDASDSIPGVRGIGPKTAARLLLHHHSIEGVYESFSSLKPADARKLDGQQAAVSMYKGLVTLRPEAAPVLPPAAAALQGFAVSEVAPLLQRLHMTSLLQKDLGRLQTLLGGAAPACADLAAAVEDAVQQLSGMWPVPGCPEDEDGPAAELAAAAPSAAGAPPPAASAGSAARMGTRRRRRSTSRSTLQHAREGAS